MAGIDKIYGSQDDYYKLNAWLKRYASKDFLDSMYSENDWELEDRPLASFSLSQDRWLWKMCGMKLVWDRLKEQYGPFGPRKWRKNEKFRFWWHSCKRRRTRHNRKSWRMFYLGRFVR